jgi:hypothetical protein
MAMVRRAPGHRLLWTFLLALLTACSSGPPHPARRPNGQGARPPAADLAAIGTPVATPGIAGTAEAYSLTANALNGLAPFTGGRPPQLAPPQFLYGNSTIGVLELAAGASAPYAEVPGLLKQLGWSSLVSMDALWAVPPGTFGQWTVRVYHFGSAASASSYARGPFMLPTALSKAAMSPAPAGGVGGAALWQAPDTIVPLLSPGSSLAGSRAALVWSRGQIVFELLQALVPAGPDLAPLLHLAADVDAHATEIPAATMQ